MERITNHPFLSRIGIGIVAGYILGYLVWVDTFGQQVDCSVWTLYCYAQGSFFSSLFALLGLTIGALSAAHSRGGE